MCYNVKPRSLYHDYKEKFPLKDNVYFFVPYNWAKNYDLLNSTNRLSMSALKIATSPIIPPTHLTTAIGRPVIPTIGQPTITTVEPPITATSKTANLHKQTTTVLAPITSTRVLNQFCYRLHLEITSFPIF